MIILYIFILSTRKRFNESAEIISKEANAAELSEFLKTLSNDFRKTSENFASFAELLKKDEKFATPENVEKQRRNIQNNLDSIRYCSPLMVNLSKIVVPIGDPNGKLRVTE